MNEYVIYDKQSGFYCSKLNHTRKLDGSPPRHFTTLSIKDAVIFESANKAMDFAIELNQAGYNGTRWAAYKIDLEIL